MSMNKKAEQKQSKRRLQFDLDGLKNMRPAAIQRTAEIYPDLSQPQRDLIRHQAPEAYDAIVAISQHIVEGVNSANNATHKAQANSSGQAYKTHRETLHSDKSESEKRDSYEKNDRMHERETTAHTSRHTTTMETYKDLGTKALAAVVLVAGGAIAIFGIGRKK
jgi:hypothetical protein